MGRLAWVFVFVVSLSMVLPSQETSHVEDHSMAFAISSLFENLEEKIEDILSTTQFHLDDSAARNKRDSLAEEPSQLRILPLKLSQASSSDFLNDENFKFFHWNGGLYCVGFRNWESSVYAVTLSDNEIYLDEIMKLPSTAEFLQKIDMIEVLVTDDALWIITANHNSSNILAIKAVLGYGRRISGIHQIIPVNGSVGGIHVFKDGDKIYMVIITREGETADSNLTSEIYVMKKNLFEKDRIFSYLSKSSSARISTFRHRGVTYLTIIEETGGGGIYSFTSSDTEIQVVHKMRDDALYAFEYESSSSEKQSVVIVGRTGACEIFFIEENNLASQRLFEIESIANSTEALLMNLRGSHYLLVVNENKIIVYEESAGKFIKKLVDRTQCRDVLSLEATNYEDRLLFSLLCKTEQGELSRTFLYMDFYSANGNILADEPFNNSPKTSESPDVDKCLDELDAVLKRNRPFIRDLQSILDKGLLITAAHYNSLSDPVSFGVVETDDIEAQSLNLEPPEELKLLDARIAELAEKILMYTTKMKAIEAELPSLLTYSTDQHITTSARMNKMVANSTNIFAIDIQKLNDIPIDVYKNDFLRLEDDQEISTNIVLDKLITKNIEATALSNNLVTVEPKDFLDKWAPDQIVTGHHSFTSVEIVGDIERVDPRAPLVINGIPTDLLIKSTATEGPISDTKTFTQPLIVRQSLNVELINGVDYDVWQDSLIRTGTASKMSIPESLVVQGNVVVKGNVKVMSINGIDVPEFADSVVRKNGGHQFVHGPVEFFSPLAVGSLQVNEVNEVRWSDYLRVANSTVKAKFFIDEGVVVGNLVSDSVNGIDLDREAVLTDTDQVIEGQVTFTSDIEISGPEGVTMATGTTINGIDPSLHLPFGIGLHHKVFNREINIGHDLRVKGDVQITNINGRPFPDLQNNFWRKSVSQKIPIDVTIRNAVFEKDLFASGLNGLGVEDYMQTNVEQIVTGRNYFTSLVEVSGNVDLQDGRTFDHVNLEELRNKAVRIYGRQTIYGVTEFDAEIQAENLIVKNGYLKGINIDDLVYGNNSISLNKASFIGPVSAHQVVVMGSLEVDSLNEKEPRQILKPKINPLNKIEGNLYLGDIEVKDMNVAGDFCGVDFSQWVKRTVPKDGFASQSFLKNVTIHGEVNFKGPVELETANDKDWNEHFKQLAQTCDGCRISGAKTFLGPLNVYGNVTAASINGIDLERLADRILSKTKSQLVGATYTFSGGVAAVSVETPVVSGIPVKDIAMIDQPTELKGTSVFATNVNFGKIKSNHNWIDGCNIDLALNPPKIEAGNLISSDVSLGHLKVEGNVSVDGNLLSRRGDINVLSFLNRVVKRSLDQDVSGETFFEEETFVRKLETKTVNKVPVDIFLKKFTEKVKDLDINCNITFLEPLTVGTLTTRDIIPASSDLKLNGLRIADIKEYGVPKDSKVVIRGKKTIKGLFVEDNIEVKNLNQIPFDQFVQLDDKHYGERLEFLEPIYIEGDVNVRGLILQQQPEELLKPFESSKAVEYPSILPPRYNLIEVKGDLIVDSINGLSLNDLATNFEEYQIITGQKTAIGGIYVDGAVSISEINGIDLEQFNRWSEFYLHEFSDDALESLFMNPGESSLTSAMRRTYLEKTAFRLRRLNEINFLDARNLHQELMLITEKSRVYAPGRVTGLLPYQKLSTPPSVFAIVQNTDLCSDKARCPCLATYNYIIDGENGLKEGIPFTDGLHVVIIPDIENQIYDFITPCSLDEPSHSTIRRLDFEQNILNYRSLDLGVIRKVLTFTEDDIIYFVVLSKYFSDSRNGFKDRIHVLRAENDFGIAWKKTLLVAATDIALQKINGKWIIVVAGDTLKTTTSMEAGFQSETQIYQWDNQQFTLIGQMEPASTVELLTFNDNQLLILGQWKTLAASDRRKGRGLGHMVKVYKMASNSTTFIPYASLAMEGVSDASAFTIGSYFYFAAASYTEGSVRVFRMINLEGFEEIGSITVENPTSLLYVPEGRNHFLVVTSQTYVILLQLHFDGVDGTLVIDPYP